MKQSLFIKKIRVLVTMENLSLRLPEYEVLVHIKVNEFSKHLEEEIESLTTTYDLEDSTEGQGRKDYHWEFKTWKEAVLAGENLKNLITNPSLIKLKVKANYHPEIKPIIHKD
jgi:hypothetical protein